LKSYSKTAGGFILALFVAVAFTGVASPSPIGINSDCMDGIDQDGDGTIDEMDDQCWEYPFADGAGEYQTTFGPTGKMFSSDSYEMSVWDWQNQVAPHIFQPGSQICFDNSVYSQIDQVSDGDDPSLTQYNDWIALNCN